MVYHRRLCNVYVWGIKTRYKNVGAASCILILPLTFRAPITSLPHVFSMFILLSSIKLIGKFRSNADKQFQSLLCGHAKENSTNTHNYDLLNGIRKVQALFQMYLLPKDFI